MTVCPTHGTRLTTAVAGGCIECALRIPGPRGHGRRRDVTRGGNPRANPPCLCHCPKATHSPWSPTGERVGPCEAPGCVADGRCDRYRPDGDDL